ncbi:sensor histidine kinase [Phytohabitans houttuyneae]|uniref:Histidine kinase n=1 Tax=Phytohabitans houttuyneae TaxID=1076126 RepID=A0A6V8K266_9ACTN|nr:histidine kinase [Phytohabitans houttuyneae]
MRGRVFHLWYGVWLVYLIEPLVQAWREDRPAVRALGVVAVGLFAAIFIWFFSAFRRAREQRRPIPGWWGWASVAAMFALSLAIMPAIGESALGMYAFIAVVALFALPRRAAVALAAALVLAPSVVPYAVPGWEPRFDLSFSIFLACLIVLGVTQLLKRNSELAAAREEIARLAVADERNRLARDLHDLLGHSLTVVAVKAELAGRLVRLAPERAEEEIGDVERLARQSLRDVRAAVAGYAQASLAAELAGAQAALTSAGIEADLPEDVEQVPPERRELFGWVVREGVTNVVRHSGAKRCRIRVTPREVEVTDDGHGPDGASTGRGLAGLRERAEAAGGSLTVGRAPERGFTLRVRVP